MIDCHCHGVPNEDTVDAARALGVESVGLIGWGPDVLAARARFGDFIRPIIQCDMSKWRANDIHYWAGSAAVAIKFTMPREPYSAPRYWPLYDACVEHGLTAVFHSGYLGFYGSESIAVHMQHTAPCELDWIARNWPDLRIIMAHFGNPFWDDAFKVLAANPNVYADLSGGSAYRRDMADWVRLFAPNGEPRVEVLSKLLFGTDKTFGKDYAERLPGYVDFYAQLAAKAGIGAATSECIASGNAARLLTRR